MIPKNRRIPRELFKDILSSKRYLNSESFTLRVGSSKEARAAVSVSKKVSKSAVMRNTVRRRTYSVLEETIHKIKPGLYLFIAKPGAQKLKGENLKKEINSLVVSYEL